MTLPLPAVLIDWLRSATAEPIDAKYVPGASTEERGWLAALGGLAHQLDPPNAELLPAAVNEWFASGPTPPKSVLAAARKSLDEDPDESLAAMYSGLVRGSSRRSLGTFFTPSPEATLMLDMWAATQPAPKHVVDIGAGVGVFTATAAQKWPSAQVTAIDVNPVTLGLLALHPRVSETLSKKSGSSGIRLVLDDFTRWIEHLPEDDAAGRLYLGNPPYTRAQLLPREDRQRLQEAVGGLVGGRASLSASITALCVRRLRPTDGMCLLLPAQWLESDYARLLRQRLWSETQRRIELRLVDSRLFPDAQVDALALLVGTEQSAAQPFAIGQFDGELVRADRTQACPPDWRNLFASPAGLSRETSGSLRLHEIADVRRGLATGANAFFLPRPSAVKDHKLPSEVLRPVIRRLNGIGETVHRDLFEDLEATEPRFVLVATENDRVKYDAVDAYLKVGETEGLDQRELCSRRDVWFDVNHDAYVPDVIITAMTRDKFRIVTNDAGAIITNNLYGWRWKSTTHETTRARIIAWLRSDEGQAALRSAARSQGDGLYKLEPRGLRDLRFPSLPAN